MEPGQVLADRFRIDAPLGEGGIGRVFRAWDLRSSTAVALKVLRPELAREARVRRRFRREARAVGRLVHPHIVRLLAYGEDAGGTPYLVMELIEGRSLADLRDDGLPLDGLLTVIDQILGALAFAHARGVVHRDVKPENIIVHLDGTAPRAKLLDFGFARVEDDQDPRLTQAHGDAFGTPMYMAPEQASGRSSVGPPTDLYGVGVILYEFLAGRPPFTGAHGMAVALKHLMEDVPPLVPRPGWQVPAGLERVVRRALEKDPRDRYQTAADMRRALSPFLLRGGGDGEIGSVDELPDADETIAQTLVPAGGGLGAAASLAFDDTAVGEVVDLGAAPLEPVDTEADPVPPMEAFGGAAPMGGVAEEGGEGAVLAPEAEAPFVGREADMIWLWERVREVVEGGEARVALLGAAPGMGRGRLVRWLRDQMAEGGWMLCVGGVHGPGLGPEAGLRGALDELFGHLPPDRRGADERMREVVLRWGTAAGATPAETGREAAGVSALLSFLRPAATAGESAPPALRGEVLYDRICEVLRTAARERPVLLTLESLEHATPETFGFLRFLADTAARRPFPILVVATHVTDDDGRRPPELDAALEPLIAVGEPLVALRQLPPLEAVHVLALLQALAPFEDAVARAIARRARGNPFFALELARLLYQTGELVERAGRLRLSAAAEPAAWPGTLSETALRRVRRTVAGLPDAELVRAVLDHAVVLGEVFDYDLLVSFVGEAMANDTAGEGRVDRRIEAAIEALIRTRVLVEHRSPQVDRLGFVHAVLRAALLDEAARSSRAPDLHRRAAEAKLAQHGTRDLALALQIAEHYRSAGLPLEATRFYVEAAGHAQRENQLDRARQLLETADGLLAGRSDGSAERQRAVLWLDLGELELRLGTAARARALATRVCGWARRAGEPLLEGRALLLVSDELRAAGDAVQAGRGYARAREAFERAGHAPGVARCLLGQAMVERAQGRLDVAEGLFEQAAAAMERVGDAYGAGRAWRGRGEMALRRGDLAEAGRLLETALRHFVTAGHRAGATQCHWLLGETWRRLDDPERARSHLEAAAAGYGALGDRAGLARCHLGLGRLLRALGRWDEAADLLESAAAAFEGLGDRGRAATARAELGLGAVAEGELERAERSLEAALDVAAADASARRGRSGVREAVLRAALAWVAAQRGDDRTSGAALRAALELDAAQPAADPEMARILEGIGDLDARRGRALRAQRLYQRAAHVHRSLGAAAEFARLDEKAARLRPTEAR